MTTPTSLHITLLRPAIIHILRASGFHSSRPSVIDTLTDLTARYLLLIASRTAQNTYDRTIACGTDDPAPRRDEEPSDEDNDENDLTPQTLYPTLPDVRLALTTASFFVPTTTASEQAWAETLRKPLSSYPAGARDKERRRRDAEDTRDVREFVDWAMGPAAREIRRIAGQLREASSDRDKDGGVSGGLGTSLVASGPPGTTVEPAPAATTEVQKDDYIALLKRKHGGKEPAARYAGTLLGERTDDASRMRKIEGGPASVDEWVQGLKRKRVDDAAARV